MAFQAVENIFLQRTDFPVFRPQHINPVIFRQEGIHQLECHGAMDMVIAGQSVKSGDRIGEAGKHVGERAVPDIGMFRPVFPVPERPVIQRFIPDAFIHGSPMACHKGIESLPSFFTGKSHFRHNQAPVCQAVEHIARRPFFIINQGDESV